MKALANYVQFLAVVMIGGAVVLRGIRMFTHAVGNDTAFGASERASLLFIEGVALLILALELKR